MKTAIPLAFGGRRSASGSTRAAGDGDGRPDDVGRRADFTLALIVPERASASQRERRVEVVRIVRGAGTSCARRRRRATPLPDRDRDRVRRPGRALCSRSRVVIVVTADRRRVYGRLRSPVRSTTVKIDRPDVGRAVAVVEHGVDRRGLEDLDRPVASVWPAASWICDASRGIRQQDAVERLVARHAT